MGAKGQKYGETESDAEVAIEPVKEGGGGRRRWVLRNLVSRAGI
jgi:hypothetical protein